MKPEVVGPVIDPNEVIRLMILQLEILKMMGQPIVFIPSSSGVNLK